jgi:hypothetical protein
MAHPLTAILPLDPSKNVAVLLAKIAKHKAEVDAALTKVGTVHFARLILFDLSNDDLCPTLISDSPSGRGPYALGVITEFDEDFVAEVGFLFNLGLEYSTDGQALVPVEEHVQEFADYLKKHDLSQHLPNKGLYSASQMNVQQILCCPENIVAQA